MNPFEMVVLIVAIVMFANVIRSRGGLRRRLHGDDDAQPAQDRAETMRLREEVQALKDRIHVLERIAVEKEDRLSRQIEELRDR